MDAGELPNGGIWAAYRSHSARCSAASAILASAFASTCGSMVGGGFGPSIEMAACFRSTAQRSGPATHPRRLDQLARIPGEGLGGMLSWH